MGAKKKNIKIEDIISMYMDYVLEHNKEPKSVYKFCKENNFEESLFYQFYTSFQSVKDSIFTAFHHNTIALLDKSEDFKSFDARNKLLSYYYTFFEMLTANRSYVVYALQQNKNKLENFKTLKDLRKEFKEFISQLDIEKLEIKQERIQKIQDKTIEESAWIQLVLTMRFWLDDTSASFEKTDIFIEKSVNASFDLMNIAPLKSVIDLGKFLFKEKMMR